MGISKFFTALAISSALLLDQASQAVACTCLAVYFTPCDYVQGLATPAPTTVVRAVVLSKSDQADINDDVSFTVEVTTVYTDIKVDNEITFTTAGNSAACGVDLTIGEEYILGLYPAVDDPFDSTDVTGGLTVGACDLARLWSSVPADEQTAVEAGCPADGCNLICDDKQECVQYEKNGKYYCSDTCDNPGSCADGKQCTTRPRRWCRKSGFDGCPEKRKCR